MYIDFFLDIVYSSDPLRNVYNSKNMESLRDVPFWGYNTLITMKTRLGVIQGH